MKRHSNSSSSLSVASDPPLPVLTAVDPLPEALPTQPPPYRQIKLALNVPAGDLLVQLLNRNALASGNDNNGGSNDLEWLPKVAA